MKRIYSKLVNFVRQNPATTVLIFVAAVLHLLIILPSGSHYCFNGYCGDYFWGVHEHDGIWHIAVAETAFGSGSIPLNPSYSGAYLSGYNILLDYIIFFFTKVGISSFFTYFKILPIVWYVLFTYSAIRCFRLFSKEKLPLFIFLFLSYFGTSFGFIFALIKNRSFDGVTEVTIMQPILSLTNLQLAFSYIALLWVIIIILEHNRDYYKVIFISLSLFFAWGLKFYSGLLASVIVGLFYLITARENKKYNYLLWIIMFMIASFLAILMIYNPFLQNGSFSSTFIFRPLALIWPYIEDSGSIFYSPYWANAKYIYLSSAKISLRFLIFEALLVFGYLFLNFGMRVCSIFYAVGRKLKTIDIAIGAAIGVGIFASLAFIQKGVWWNVVQFLYVSSFLLNIYVALSISKMRRRSLSYLFIFLTIVTAIPYSFASLKSYVTFGYNYVSDNEKKALSFLKKSKVGVIYSPLYSKNRPFVDKVRDLRLSSDNSYISAYTGKQMYVQVTGAILLSNDYVQREKKIHNGDCTIMQDINYVYFNNDSIDLFIKKCIIKNIAFSRQYANGGYMIYSKK